MATVPSTASPPRSFDETGRALPLTPEEVRQRAEMAIQALESLDDIGDEAEHRESLDFLIGALNPESPERPRSDNLSPGDGRRIGAIIGSVLLIPAYLMLFIVGRDPHGDSSWGWNLGSVLSGVGAGTLYGVLMGGGIGWIVEAIRRGGRNGGNKHGDR
jgi:hypothetical protein